jgi:hypothetical protein
MNLLLTSATNPGTLEPVSNVVYIGLTLVVSALIFVIVGIALMGGIHSSSTDTERRKQRNAGFWSLAAGGVIGAIGLTIVISTFTDTGDARAEYSESVSAWLQDEYQIAATPENALHLAYGKEFTVNYNGDITIVHTVKDIHDDLVLLDEYDKPLDVVSR